MDEALYRERDRTSGAPSRMAGLRVTTQAFFEDLRALKQAMIRQADFNQNVQKSIVLISQEVGKIKQQLAESEKKLVLK
jgi:hypothetical protein